MSNGSEKRKAKSEELKALSYSSLSFKFTSRGSPLLGTLFALSFSLPVRAEVVTTSTAVPVSVSTATVVQTSTSVPVTLSTYTVVQLPPPGLVTILHPAEGAKLPALKEVFVYGSVIAGSTLTINGSTVTVHAKGGYLTMVPLLSGPMLLSVDAKTPGRSLAHVERHFIVAPNFVPSPLSPLTLVKESISPNDDMVMAPGDTVRVTFQGSPEGSAEFAIEGVSAHIPMVEIGNPPRGIYEGSYVIQPDDHADKTTIFVTLKKRDTKKERAAGRLTIESGGVPRVGLVTEETVASRTSVEGGYDVFLYKGMHVRLTGKIGRQWRVRFSGTQVGWVKESAIQELPKGTLAPQSLLANIAVTHQGESSIIKIPLVDMLPYRLEQNLDPPSLSITLFGASDKTDLIRYDPIDPLIRLVHWRQLSPETCQLVIEPKFKKWWGYDVRYEGNTLVVEIRKPWMLDSLKNMVIAVDAGHGGSDTGAVGPHATYEKDANLQIATWVKDFLEKAGAKPFLIRTTDVDVTLYDRPKIAWRNKARLFVSVHCNASGLGENPLWNNGSSVYFNQPQSKELAELIHAGYRKHAPLLQDHGLFYADFAVCRMTQMPSVLTEQAYIIVPEQEDMLFNPTFQKSLANAIVYGIKAFVSKP